MDHLVGVEEVQGLKTLKRDRMTSEHFLRPLRLHPEHEALGVVTSLHTAAIWPSSMQVSVTTSVREPPAKYSITTHSSSPTK